MSFTLFIPTKNSPHQLPASVRLCHGEATFVLGVNGTGKSSLLQLAYSQNIGDAKRIAAHRQTFFSSDSIDLSANARKQGELHIRNYDVQHSARYKDDFSSQRSSFTVFDLIDSENQRARLIARAVDKNDIAYAHQLSLNDSPIKIINELLTLSYIPIQLSIDSGDQIQASRSGSPSYSMARLSDGERNAVLICADVLTAKPQSLIIIDEPERHLHRSIISPLLTNLLKKRKDCAFLVSTHDITLASDNPGSTIVLSRSCSYSGDTPTAWDIDILSPGQKLGEDLRSNILGSRRDVLFVEGGFGSLDVPLYAALFPSASIIPKGSCRDVIAAVRSIRGSVDLHWLNARGIVDADSRSDVKSAELLSDGIFTVPFYSVESVYFHPEMLKHLAVRQSQVLGGEPDRITRDAISAALTAIIPHKKRLINNRLGQIAREEIFSHLPTKEAIESRSGIAINIDLAVIESILNQKFDAAVEAGDFAGIVAKYPIRETPAVSMIVNTFRFKHLSDYEGAFLKMLIDDSEALAKARSFYELLCADMKLYN